MKFLAIQGQSKRQRNILGNLKTYFSICFNQAEILHCLLLILKLYKHRSLET